MSYNIDRAIGCCIGYNAVIKAVRYVEKHQRIPPSSARLRHVLKVIYGRNMYNYYLSRTTRMSLRLVA